MKNVLVVTALLLALTGCEVKTWSSNGDVSSSSSYSGAKIGQACDTTGDCEGSAICASNYPGGYCFMTCTGNPSVCPSSTMCVNVSGSSSECYSTCMRSSDCRSGYSCYEVTNSTEGICMPD